MIATKCSHFPATSPSLTNKKQAKEDHQSDRERLLIKKQAINGNSKTNQPPISRQQVPFLQRKFNLFGNLSGANSHSSTSDGKVKLAKSTATTLPRSTANKLTNPTPARSRSKSPVQTNKTDNSDDTFKGVQSLRQFWNSRIIGNSANQSKEPKVSSKVISSKNTKVDNTVSENCRSVPPSSKNNTSNKQKSAESEQKDKHNLDKTVNDSGEQVSLREKFIKSDNFNKFKTASTVKSHRISQEDNSSSKRSKLEGKSNPPAKRHTIDCVPKLNVPQPSVAPPNGQISTLSRCSAKSSTLKFPQIATTATGGKIHWARRDDILGPCIKNKNNPDKSSEQVKEMIKESENKNKTKPLLGISNQNPETIMDATDKMDCPNGIELKNREEMALESPSKDRPSRSTTPSSTRSTVTSNNRTDSPRKSNSHRKASFKTHSGQSQSIRKMAIGGSKVAALTHRFNQMIHQDSTILEEVKRKGVVVHKVNGHIYKIREEPSSNNSSDKNELVNCSNKKKLVAKTSSTSGDPKGHSKVNRRRSSAKRRESIKKSASINSIDKKGVKATIQLFETTPNSKTQSGMVIKKNMIKPKVPDKSENVLKRTKEIASIRKSTVKEPNQLEVTSTDNSLISNAKKSLKLDGIKSPVVKEKMLTPIQEILTIVPDVVSEPPQKEEVSSSPVPSIKELPLTDEVIKSKKDKSMYNRIYDKIKLNKPSFLYSKKKAECPALHISTPILNSSTYELNDSVPIPERKIYEALHTVNQKIEVLSRSSMELNFGDCEDTQGKDIKPNQSFLFRATTKPIKGQSSVDLFKEEEPCEALNVSLIKSKTQSMDETLFPVSHTSVKINNSTLNVVEITENLESDPVQDISNYKEFKDILKETDELIKKMNKTYAEHEFNLSEKTDTITKDRDAVVATENNYELYEQIESDDGSDVKGQVIVPEESLYQTVSEVKSAIRNGSKGDRHLQDTSSVNSYESFDNYEAIDELRRVYNKSRDENGYEICEPPEPPPPRKISNIIDDPNSPPSLPMPKRNLNNQTTPKYYSGESEPKIVPEPKDNTISSSDIFHNDHDYEENIYDTIKGADNTSLLSNNYESISLLNHNLSRKTSPITMSNGKKAGAKDQQPDTISYISNCYESLQGSTLTINQIGKDRCKRDDFYRLGHALRHSDSVSTLSSDHKTNSLYGTPFNYGQSLATNNGSNRSSVVVENGLDNQENEVYSKIKPPSENGTSYSENSDEWIDMSDGEEETGKHKLIIIRERSKCHPDWSRKIREQRIHQAHFYEVSITSQSTIYLVEKCEQSQLDTNQEPLYQNTASESNDHDERSSDKTSKQKPLNVCRSVTFLRKKAIFECFNNAYEDKNNKLNFDLQKASANNKVVEWESQHLSVFIDDSDHHYESLYSDHYENQQGASSPSEAQPKRMDLPFDEEEFDSFDSELETDEDVKKNDSGVDVSNMKLPDPPSSSNQVYALMQKFKNPLSEISKSLTRFAKKKKPFKGSESSRKYENLNDSSSNYYQANLRATDKTLSKSKKGSSSTLNVTPKSSDLYENTQFHTPRTPIIAPQQLPNLGAPLSESTPSSPPIPQSNSKDSQSFSEYNGNPPATVVPVPRKKKGAKSFKSKLRRSLVSDNSNLTAFNTNRSTFYISDSVDVDSGIFTGSDKTLKAEDSNSSLKLESSMSDLVNEIKSRNLKNAINTSNEDVSRRRSTSTSSRPLSPPPPPPTIITPTGMEKTLTNKKRTSSKTSWYDECGVFKSEVVKEVDKKHSQSMTNWYADAGLYQTSGDSVASSSGSSGVSTGGECNGVDDNSHSLFCNEPLYQIYSAAKVEAISRDIEMENEHDGYEEIGKSIHPGEELKKPCRPTALQLVGPKQGPSRTLWSEIPEVINSEILSTLTPTEKRLQEAKFEIVTSEASYFKSLNLLKSHFMNHPAFRDINILSAADRKTLFSYTVPVLECSDRLLCDLENCWQDNIMLLGLSHSIYKHADASFKVYVNYCEHQVRLDRMLKKLKESNRKFCEILEQQEADPVCCGLSFHSFLMLPMQRITRLPLLIDAVLSKLKADDDEYENWKMTLAILNKIVSQCNEAAHRCEQAYEMQYISRQIEFPTDISPLPILPVGIPAVNSRPRALVRKGELSHLVWRGDDGKLTFGKKFTKSTIFAFLFTDLLVLTKKKGDESFLVFDYCPRSMLTVSSGDVIPQLPTKEVSLAGKHLILMTLLENNHGKTVELILSCQSETDRTRWLQATEPPASDNPDETLYEQWDCPQVIVQHGYQATQPDELNLDPGDIVNVTRKMADGWYHGERIRDGAQGWFPGNYTEEVASPHVRARNLKQRYRLLTFTATYLESQKKK